MKAISTEEIFWKAFFGSYTLHMSKHQLGNQHRKKSMTMMMSIFTTRFLASLVDVLRATVGLSLRFFFLAFTEPPPLVAIIVVDSSASPSLVMFSVSGVPFSRLSVNLNQQNGFHRILGCKTLSMEYFMTIYVNDIL